MKKFLMAMAVVLLSATMFTGCNDNGNNPDDPSSPGTTEEASIYKQWTYHVSGTKYETIDLSTQNQSVWATSYDGTNYYISGTYPATISFSNTEKTAGTVNYNMYGARTLKFRNLTSTSVEFESQQTSAMPGMYDTYTVTTHTLQTR